jgi:ATP-dependent Clp protease adapter protein ClpS
MEDPIHEISDVIHTLTQSPPSQQAACVESYFTPTASFTHPFCRTYSFGSEYLPHVGGASLSSRWFILKIYQWYKILSPHIDLEIESVAFDAQNLLLYVSIHQIFKIQWIPFHNSDVRLTTVLKLVEDEARKHEIEEFSTKQAKKMLKNDYAALRAPHKRYLIQAQNDLYQTNEFVKFVFFFGGSSVIMAWQFFATFACVLGAVIMWPVTYLSDVAYERQEAMEEEAKSRHMQIQEVEDEHGATAILSKVKGWVSTGNGSTESEKED